MQYALLIYTKPGAWEELSPEEQGAVHGEYMAINGETGIVGGNQLQPTETATTIRVDGTQTLSTDGPFADTKEILGGYYLMEAGDLDAALAVAAKIPAARMGGAVEVRPVVEM